MARPLPLERRLRRLGAIAADDTRPENERRAAWNDLVRLHRQRDPFTVRRMEKAKGLR